MIVESEIGYLVECLFRSLFLSVVLAVFLLCFGSFLSF